MKYSKIFFFGLVVMMFSCYSLDKDNNNQSAEIMENENPFHANNKDDKNEQKENKISTNIDDIFIRITDLYTQEHIQVIWL